MQKRTHSLIESFLNQIIGYLVGIASQYVIFPIYHLQVSLEDNLQIGLWFALFSTVRSYIIRRWFNRYVDRT